MMEEITLIPLTLRDELLLYDVYLWNKWIGTLKGYQMFKTPGMAAWEAYYNSLGGNPLSRDVLLDYWNRLEGTHQSLWDSIALAAIETYRRNLSNQPSVEQPREAIKPNFMEITRDVAGR